jgi:hypothetical protein
MLLAQAERRLGIADRLAAVIPDVRDASRVTYLLPDILRARIFAIACGYEDGDDLDRLRLDPAFKLACGRLPDTGDDLCSQPTISRWENVPSLRDLIRLMGVMVDLYCTSGKTYEFGGPRVYSFKVLLELLLNALNRQRVLIPIPFGLAEMQARLLELFPNPPLTRDQVRLLKTDKVVSGMDPTLGDLGVHPRPLEDFLTVFKDKHC